MAARTRRGTRTVPWNEKTRAKIQSGMLIYVLEKHVLGKKEMKSTQVRAAEILLRKSIPDLTQINGPGEEGEHTVVNRVEEIIVDPKR